MLTPGGQYQIEVLQSAAVAQGNGTPLECTDSSGGASKILTLQVQGMSSGTITWEATIDGTNWKGLLVTPLATGTAALTATADGLYSVDVTGLSKFRARISAWASGATTVTGVLTAL
jgi:hypothetical protein